MWEGYRAVRILMYCRRECKLDKPIRKTLEVELPRQQILWWRLACRKFIREHFWNQHQGKGKTRKNRKELWAERKAGLQGSLRIEALKLGWMTIQSYSEVGQGTSVLYPWSVINPWRRERLPTPVFWPGEFHGLYSPWVQKESDTTEWISLLQWPLDRDFVPDHQLNSSMKIYKTF